MLQRSCRWSLFVLVIAGACCTPCSAQSRAYAGAVAGFAILSGDGKSNFAPVSGAASGYDPKTGPAVNLFAGMHFSEYVSFQGNYIWNRNSLTLTAARFGDQPATFYEQRQSSQQHSGVVDLLLYFRDRQSWARPYLSTGLGVSHLDSTVERTTVRTGTLDPPDSFSSNVPVLRVAVGIDVRLKARWYARYSFSESISANPISDQLAPPGRRSLKNFQNLFGLFRVF